MRTLFLTALAFCLVRQSLVFAQEQEKNAEMAQTAVRILTERCSRCHGGSSKQAGLDVLSRQILIEKRGEASKEISFVIPGDPKNSMLLQAIDGEDSYMPEAGSPEAEAMTTDEKNLLRNWVEAGAPFPVRRNVTFISDKAVLTAIREHLLKTKADDRKFTRFYTLTHLQNNDSISELDLRYYRAAFVKVINSLSNERAIYFPPILTNTGESVFVVDLRKLGWDKNNIWEEILTEYPYGLKYNFVKDEDLKQLGNDIELLSGNSLPFLRADWFTITATQPPLYHSLLDIPDRLSKLEQQLGINILDNFKNDKLQRAGYAKSGVSKQNRLLERHTSSKTDYFWISYDFLPRKSKGDLVRFPLGPVFEGNPFQQQAFVHDGGEIIWSLPNGLQAYMLVNAKGDRIDSGPIDVVFDRAAILGTPSIINGVSCMYCHREGMISNFRDEIRGADAVGGLAREKVLAVYPTDQEMQKLVKQDQDLFLRSLEHVVGPYLKVSEDSNKPITGFAEPVGKVAEMYARDLTLKEAALELGIEKPESFVAKIESNRELLRYGLGTFVQDPPGTLKREKWESRDGTSLMQDIAAELRSGVPIIR